LNLSRCDRALARSQTVARRSLMLCGVQEKKKEELLKEHPKERK
jgi:hypothetical protein